MMYTLIFRIGPFFARRTSDMIPPEIRIVASTAEPRFRVQLPHGSASRALRLVAENWRDGRAQAIARAHMGQDDRWWSMMIHDDPKRGVLFLSR